MKGSRSPNVICTLPGESGAVILTGAHFDFSGRGKGVVDNWSGAALLPSLYQSLADRPRRHTFVFVGYTGEEAGLLGSQSYVKQLTPEQRSKIAAAVNLDCLGLSSTKLWLTV
jgi:Zn-dependent M28 family amino/carboxypeptidase